MKADPLPQLRKLCLALPEATEKIAWGEPTFRVRDKMFAMYSNNHHGDGRIAVVVKAAKEFQEVLVSADPKRFYVPPYVGHKGWVGVRLDVAVDWAELADILRDAYLMIAPPKLAAQLGSAGNREPSPTKAPRQAKAKARPREARKLS